MVWAGDFLWAKVSQSHIGHGVVGRMQSGFGNKVWIGMRMVLFLMIVVV